MADASRYQLAGRVIERHRGPVDLLSDHPATVVGWLLALEGTLSEHLRTTAELRDFDAAAAARFVEGYAAEKAKGDREKVADAFVQALRAARPGGQLPRAQGRAGLDGLLRPGRAGRSAVPGAAGRRRAAARRVPHRAARRVPGHLGGPGGDAQPAVRRGHPVTAVGDPNQAIYGWRGASVSNILRFAEHFPRRRRRARPRRTRCRTTGAPTSGSSRSRTCWPSRCSRSIPRCRR